MRSENVRSRLVPSSIERTALLALAGLLLLLTAGLTATAWVSVRRQAEQAATERLASDASAVGRLLATALPRALAQAKERSAEEAALARTLGFPGEDRYRSEALAWLRDRAREPNMLGAELRDLSGARVAAAGRSARSPAVPLAAVAGGLGVGLEEGGIGRLHTLGDEVAAPLVVALELDGNRVGFLVEWRRLLLDLPLSSRLLIGNRAGGPWTDGRGVVERPPLDLSPATEAGSSVARVIRYRRADGSSQLARPFPIVEAPWLGVVEMPAAAVAAPVRRFLLGMAAVASLLFLTSLAAGWLWSRRLTRPLVELSRAAYSIAEGDLSARVAERRHDEIGQLASAFNEMAERLAQARAQLARQVEELQHAREQFTRAQRMEVVGLLAGGIAHDFNNVLTIILGEAELALSDPDTGSTARQSLAEIAAAGQRAAALTRQLLVFSRGQLVKPSVFDLSDMLGESARMIRRLLGSKIEVQVRLADAPAPVLADRGQLEQVVMNLVVNARDAMPGGGRVFLETQTTMLDATGGGLSSRLTPGRYCVIAVSDTGAGMSGEVRARLFEPFFTTKQAGKGTGLGLPACRWIVERWGGQISVYSEEGVGTTVKVYLPLSSEAAAPPAPEAAPAGGNETVLVIDDEPAVRELAVRILSGYGYRVLEASEPTSVLGMLRRHKVDLLITDVVLPRSSGRELAERAAEVDPDLRVLFMSGYTEDVVLQRRLLAQDVALLRKPFTAEKLARRAREALDGRAA
jgi:signal transduction histidine kinase